MDYFLFNLFFVVSLIIHKKLSPAMSLSVMSESVLFQSVCLDNNLGFFALSPPHKTLIIKLPVCPPPLGTIVILF